MRSVPPSPGGPGAAEGPTGQGSEERLLLAARGRLSWKEGHSGLWAQPGLDLCPLPAQCDRPVAGRSREQTRFTQPALWWALLPGIWDICRKSGTGCGIPQQPQLASCCR